MFLSFRPMKEKHALRDRTPVMNREYVWLLNEKYGGKVCPEFFADLKRIEAGEPLAYVIGWVDFLGCRIDLSRRPLIPRSETEWWTEKVIRNTTFSEGMRHLKILDLFSGSGCIGIALAKHFSHAQVDCADILPACLEEIAINAQLNGVSDRIRPIASDVFSSINATYDLIVANPPYIDPKRMSALERSVRDWEPKEALCAPNGIHFIQTLITMGKTYLNRGGKMYIEFDDDQKEAIQTLLHDSTWVYDFWKDQYGKWRVLALALPEL